MKIVNCSVAAIAMLPMALAAQSPQWGDLRPGPYAAGFRLVETWDRGRASAPPTDFAGRPSGSEIGVPMQLGIWYPAVRPAKTAPMGFFEMALATQHRERFGPLSAADSAETRAAVVQMVRFASGDTLPADARPAATLARATASYRNAMPSRGTFPVAIVATGGWLGATTVLAEYLATQGWIVVATAGQTDASGASQATAPGLAIDVGLNAIEFAVSHALSLPGADQRRLAVIGFNFDSFSALEYQSRYMRALAVVTVNGWQTIEERAAELRSSAWYDATRIRVPVLNVHWDQPGSSPANLAFLDGLRYAERRSLVVAGLDHFGLIGNPLAYMFARAAQRTGHQQLIRAVHTTLAGAVSGTPGLSTVDNDFPPGMLKENWYRAALPSVPTRVEFFEILANQKDLATATRLFHDARARDSTVQLFNESDNNLAALRFERANQLELALAVHALTLEAYPRSHLARNSLGNTLLARADTVGALREFETALSLLDANSTMTADEKANQARIWRAKIARLRPRSSSAVNPFS